MPNRERIIKVRYIYRTHIFTLSLLLILNLNLLGLMLTHHQALRGISSLSSLSLKYIVYLFFQDIFFFVVTIFPQVALGETALAFYTATNRTSRPIDGVSTYNVVPFEAGQYFNKIQCFCFEEQRLNPNEQVSFILMTIFFHIQSLTRLCDYKVDMPVFFYIDPDFGEDPRMESIESITLSYTFFEAKEGAALIKPPYAK